MLRFRLGTTYRKVGSGILRLLRESRTHVDRLRQGSAQPRAILFPSRDNSGGSGYLRARGVGLALRQRGWRTVIPSSSLSLRQRRRIIAWERPDVIVLQQARHPLNRPSFYPGVPCVFDLDDADILDPSCVDAVIECLCQSRCAVAGSRYVADLMRPHNPDVSVIWTCIDREPEEREPAWYERPAVVAWASLNPVAFPLEADLIQRSMIDLAKLRSFTFRLYGVSAGRGERNAEWVARYVAPIRDAGANIELIPVLGYRDFLRSLESVAVGLQPVCPENDHSRGRSFGKILAYLSSGVAVIGSDAVDHPLFFRSGQNGFLAANDPKAWTDACVRLLEDSECRNRLAIAGRTDLGRRLVASRAAELVEPVLRRAMSARPCESFPNP